MKSGAIVSLAGSGAGVLFSLEQWTHHPHNSMHLFGSRHVLSHGHTAPGCNPRDHFTNGSLSQALHYWLGHTETTHEPQAAASSGPLLSLGNSIWVTVTSACIFCSSKASFGRLLTLASNFEHLRDWSFRKDKIPCRTEELLKDSSRKAEEKHINITVLYINVPSCLW